MSSTIFLIIAIVTTGIFAVQFILSDTDVDTDMGSIVSFKGLTHFGIGFGWYMYLQDDTEVRTYLYGFIIGLFFLFAVWFQGRSPQPGRARQATHWRNGEQPPTPRRKSRRKEGRNEKITSQILDFHTKIAYLCNRNPDLDSGKTTTEGKQRKLLPFFCEPLGEPC